VTSGRKATIVGVLAAVIAAALAYVGTPAAHAALVAGFVLLAAMVAVSNGRAVRRTHALLVKEQEQRTQMLKELADVRSRLRELGRDRKVITERIDKRHAALDNKIAVAVEKLDEKLKNEVRGLAAAIRDTEIETGLAALNRYTILATRSADAGDRTD
jgi:membrane glycosyltransferase